MYEDPPSMPTSYTARMFGWFSPPAARASCSNRRRRSASSEKRRGQDLDRDVALQLMIARPVDLAHAAGAQRAENLEAAEAIADRESHRDRRDYSRGVAAASPARTTMPACRTASAASCSTTARGSCSRDGDEIHLSPKAFELLAILHRRIGRAPCRRPSCRSGCGRRRSSRRRTSRVSSPRFAARFGTPPPSPVFLRTVYRFGYRFVGEVGRAARPREPPPSRSEAVPALREPQIVLLEGANVIGRAPDATVRCDAPACRGTTRASSCRSGEATLEDLGSKNGTYLRGQRVTSARLSDGDEIRLGNAILTFRMEPALGPTETVAIDPSRGPGS